MAKKAKEENKEVKKSVASFFSALKKETGAEAFNKSKLTKVDHYVDTGCYALNRICSGSIYGGLPGGAVILFSGENSTSKTLSAFIAAKNAIDKSNYGAIIYVDTEGGANRGMLESVGINMDLVQYVPVATVEEATVKLINIYKTIASYQEQDPDFKAMVILDSLGGLVSEKVLLDADKDKSTGDLGQNAKKISNLLRAITMPAKKTNSMLFILAQQYADPNAMFASKIQNIRGGKAAYYQPSLIVQLTRKLEKGEGKEDNFYESSVIRAFTIKTRNEVRPFLETEYIIDFKHGLKTKEFYGLIAPAIQLGFIKNPKQGWYQVPSYSDKLMRLADLEGGAEAKKIWDTFIQDFDKVSKEQISYKSLSEEDSSEINEMKAELNKKFSLNAEALDEPVEETESVDEE